MSIILSVRVLDSIFQSSWTPPSFDRFLEQDLAWSNEQAERKLAEYDYRLEVLP